MNLKPPQQVSLPAQPIEQEQTAQKPVSIEVKMNLPAWMVRDQGPTVEVEDDDIDWQQKGKKP